MLQKIKELLLSSGLPINAVNMINMISLALLTLLLLFIIHFISRKLIIKLFSKVSERSKTNFDDILVSNKVPGNVAQIIPLILAIELLPIIFADYLSLEEVGLRIFKVFGIVLTLWIVRSILNTLKDYFKTLPRLKDKPIDSYIQVFMIFAWLTGIILAFAAILDQPIWKFITALGATSAVILLIFKDTIMGFVASIQVTVNDMVRIGDWITFNKYGADGDVIEINLTTVKVQNFDKTTTTIPTYALISDSFKNWRSMMDASGRRIKRAVIIKQGSIKYLTHKDIDRLKEINLIHEYLTKRQGDIDKFNMENNINKSILINGKNMTNLGVFRKYIESYLKVQSGVNKEMMIMARQLAPTTQGIPIEVYAFSNDKRWQNYEYIMADIFDHLLAARPYFELELFELNGYVSPVVES